MIDPLDEAAVSLDGRGQRVTIKGENEVVLADVIIGAPIEGRDKFRFVRLPGQKRIYAAKVDMEISTQFKDWIESGLLQVKRDEIEFITLRDYRINERTGAVDERDVLELTQREGTWQAGRMKDDEAVDTVKMNALLGALENLAIEGVRPKPEGLSVSLTQSADSLRITTADLLSLQSKGYFFSRDGQLLSNEGELQARTQKGVVYTLRFGEVAYGSGLAVSSGTEGDGDAAEEAAEHRYLFITTRFDPSRFPEPERPANEGFATKADSLWTDEDRRNKGLADAHSSWGAQVAEARQLSRELNRRFAGWYYVISSDSFEKLRVGRSELVQAKS